jgi:hypothetical protein
MAYNTQNYWGFALVYHPVFRKLENRTFQKLDVFPSSGEEGNTYPAWSLGKR